MNPITAAIGSIASILGIGTSLVTQATNLHRQLNPPQAQAQTMQCPPPRYKLEVVQMPGGQRQLICVDMVQ